MKLRPLILGVGVPARRYRPFPRVFPVRSGKAMEARDAATCLDGVMDGLGFADCCCSGTTIGVPSLYLDPETVVTTFFSAACFGSNSGLLTMASPSGMDRCPLTFPDICISSSVLPRIITQSFRIGVGVKLLDWPHSCHGLDCY